jgi:hypothetical protein
MGVVHRPDDIINRKKRVEIVTRDMNPGVRELILKIVGSWDGLKSVEELKRLVGDEKARQIIEELGLPVE